MGKKEDLRVVKTKASLYRGLLNLMKKKPFENIKVSEICSISLINRSTFYDHFNDKFELLESMLSDMRIELINSFNDKSFNGSPNERYEQNIRILLDHIEQNKEFYSAVTKINGNSIAKDMLTDAIVASALKDSQKKFSKGDVPSRTFVLFYASGFIAIILDALRDIKTFSKDDIVNTLIAFLPDMNTNKK